MVALVLTILVLEVLVVVAVVWERMV